jgi:hypothetical protein
MAVHPEWSAVLIRFLYQLEAHILLSSVEFQHRPQMCAHTSANSTTQTPFLQTSVGIVAIVS